MEQLKPIILGLIIVAVIVIYQTCAGCSLQKPLSDINPESVCSSVCALRLVLDEACTQENQGVWGVLENAVDMVDCLNKCEQAPEFSETLDPVCLSDAYAEYSTDNDTCPALTACF